MGSIFGHLAVALNGAVPCHRGQGAERPEKGQTPGCLYFHDDAMWSALKRSAMLPFDDGVKKPYRILMTPNDAIPTPRFHSRILEEVREEVAKFLKIADLVLRGWLRWGCHIWLHQMNGGPTVCLRACYVDRRIVCVGRWSTSVRASFHDTSTCYVPTK